MDATEPLAYLITFRSYGTWLHGDERGSVDRFHNHYQDPYLPHDDDWHRQDKQRLKQPPVTLNPDQRLTVEHAIRETCEIAQLVLAGYQCPNESRARRSLDGIETAGTSVECL